MQSRVHVSLEVANLASSIAFYRNLFQAEPTKVRADYANFRLEEPGLHLALVATPNRPSEPTSGPGSNRHFGIELFSNERLDAWLQRSREVGLSTKVEDDVTCCYAKAKKFWTRDPDGHNWEFWVRTSEADAMHEESAPAADLNATACCSPQPSAAQVATSCGEPKAGCCP